MKFIKTINRETNPNFGRKYDEIFWTCDIYKIVPYNYLDGAKKRNFRAYYKPEGWKNWGEFIDGDKSYKTFREAVKACEKHRQKRN